ncbi:TonB-dependent receptor [Ovoidimarina sediminis]|uniref:hypothetical protein n=1 Tax=Ovoidimarina sediminis TaxID=3079856 RepID=UPI002914035C|nr:hypothetical protein [Rhodophyticola sp. MJ-SS7]MDU8942578.1 hypothetical protein [Rhodophyticola sp. MJ-SS7]
MAVPSVAQDGEISRDGLVLTGEVVLGFEAEDNRALAANSSGTDSRLYVDYTLGGSLENELTSLEFSLGGSFQQENYATLREDDGFSDPFFRLNYSRRGAGSQLSFNVGYRQSELVDSLGLDLDGDLIDETFLRSVGDREFLTVGASAEIGIDAPVGARLDVNRTDTNYSGQVNPDVFDRTTDTVRLSTFLRPRQTLSFGIFAERSEYDAEDLNPLPTGQIIERTTDRLGVAVEYQINPILSFSGSVSADEIDEVLDTGATTNDSGIGLDLELTRQVPNGQFSIFANRTIATGISRTQVGISRALSMPRAEVTFSGGLSSSDTGDTVFFAGLDYSRAFPSGIMTAQLTQDAQVNDDDEEVLRTVFELNYQHELTPISSIGANFFYLRADDIGSGAADEGDRAELEIVYSHALNRDWDWQLGFRTRHNNPSVGSSATSNAIFTTFGRSFSIRP